MSTLPSGCLAEATSLQDVVLVLTEKIGSGHDRDVWRHPLNRALGVKVAKPEHERAQNDIDLHYSTHLEQLGVAGPHLPRVHGWVQTNRGRGLVVDLIQQPDGTPCPTLSRALRGGEITEMEAVGLIYEACEWLTRNGVILADYGTDNFLVRKSGVAGRAYLVFVDGLGTRHFDFKYWARCTFTPLEHWTARQKARTFRDRTLSMLRDRSSRLWVPKKKQHLPA